MQGIRAQDWHVIMPSRSWVAVITEAGVSVCGQDGGGTAWADALRHENHECLRKCMFLAHVEGECFLW